MNDQLWRQLVSPLKQVLSRVMDPAVSQEQDAWLKPVWIMTALVIFLGVLLTVGQRTHSWLNQPIAEIGLYGEMRHLDRQLLGAELAEEFRGRLLETDVVALRQRLEEEPWVRRASVALRWPGLIEAVLQEEVPVARWGDKGLLNQQGDIFWPALKPEYEGLPRLSGPARDTSRVMAQFHDLNQLFRQADLKIVALDLEARGAWSLTLENGMRIIAGREALNERLARFLRLYQERLAERAGQIEQVDIRYTNGIAVRWKPDANTNNIDE